MANEIYKNDANVQGLWLMEEVSGSRADSSPNGNNLTDNNTVGSSTDAQEGSRSAQFVAANNEYLSITDAAQTGLDITGNITIVGWVKPATPGASAQGLVTKRLLTGNQRSYRIIISADAGSAGQLWVDLSPDGSSSTVAIGATALSADTWAHFAFVYNGTDIRIYLNGVLDSNGSDNPKAYTGGIFNGSAAVVLGKQDGFANPLDGLLDEVAIFNRALSAAEISSIYQFGIQDVPPPVVAAPAEGAGYNAGVTYEIWFGNDAGLRQYLFSQAKDFEYLKVLNGVGYWRLNAPLTFNRQLIRRDARLEFWRAYPGGPLYLDFLGFLRYRRFHTDARGVTSVLLAGPDLNHLLWRRHVLYAAGSSQATATAEEADDLMRRIVLQNLSSSAAAARDWTSLGLSVEGDRSEAPTVTLKDFSGRRVLEVLQEIAEMSRRKGTPLYFGIVAISPTTFEFRVRSGQFGQDRTTVANQGILGVEFGNLAEPELIDDWNDEITFARATGQGEGAAAAYQEASDSTRLNASLWNRIETVVPAYSEIDDSGGLTDAAQGAVEAGRPVRRFGGRIVQTKGFVYGRDWNFGDKLGWTYLGEQGDGVGRSAKVAVDSSGRERIDARLETED